MSRAPRSVPSHARRKKVFKQTKGMRGRRKNNITTANAAADKPGEHRGAGEAPVSLTTGGATMDRVAELLQRDARLAADAVTRPHELLVTAWRTLAAPNGRAQEKQCVVFAPAAPTWPFTAPQAPAMTTIDPTASAPRTRVSGKPP